MDLDEKLDGRDVRDAIEEAIENWAYGYNDKFLARIKGDDADVTAIRLRGELSNRIVIAIKSVLKDQNSANSD
jgi:hypothetical protein